MNFYVDDEFNSTFVTYDLGVAFIFQHSQGNDDEVVGVVQYVQILKKILQLEYGPMFSPIPLFPCKWLKNGDDNKGNPTNKRDDASFLLVNFWYLLHEFNEPFVFVSHV